MAFVSNAPDLEEEKENQPNPAGGSIAPVGSGGAVRLSPTGGVASAGSAGGAGGTPSAGGTPTPSTGGQFGSLNQYLSANQGQAQPLANTLTTGINNQYNNLSNQNTSTLSGINQQVAAGAGPSNANAVIAQEQANPASFTSTPSNVASFQGLLNASYGGPASAQSTNQYQNQQNAINSAISAGQNAVSTEAGQENLLAQNEKAPTAGVTALNSAILSQSPQALQSVENAYQPFSGLLTNLQTGGGAINQNIAGEQAQATQTQQQADQAITNQINALNTGVGNELTTAQQNAAAQNAAVNAGLTSGNMTAADLAALGMTQAQWNTLSAADKAAATSQKVLSNKGQFGAMTGTATINPTQFLTQQNPNNVFTAANVATPQDYANAQAFQTLLQGMNLATPAMTINPSTAAEAGTAPTNLNSYNYGTALNTAQSTSADELASAQAYVNALQSGADEQHAQLAAQQAGRQTLEQEAMPILNTTLGAPLTIASQIPVIGKPIANAVDTVTQAISNATWICTAMREAGVMTSEEVQELHDHLYKAIWYKPWSFLQYIVIGKIVVLMANHANIIWSMWKQSFYDIPIAENNPVKAVELYEEAFWALTRTSFRLLSRKVNSID